MDFDDTPEESAFRAEVRRGLAEHAEPRRTGRQRLAALSTNVELMELTGRRSQTAMARKRAPGPESSIGKLAVCRYVSMLGDTALAIAGPAGTLADDPATSAWVWMFLDQWAIKIGGGTDQIQRDTIG